MHSCDSGDTDREQCAGVPDTEYEMPINTHENEGNVVLTNTYMAGQYCFDQISLPFSFMQAINSYNN